jgi:hypothetical protein
MERTVATAMLVTEKGAKADIPNLGVRSPRSKATKRQKEVTITETLITEKVRKVKIIHNFLLFIILLFFINIVPRYFVFTALYPNPLTVTI